MDMLKYICLRNFDFSKFEFVILKAKFYKCYFVWLTTHIKVQKNSKLNV